MTYIPLKSATESTVLNYSWIPFLSHAIGELDKILPTKARGEKKMNVNILSETSQFSTNVKLTLIWPSTDILLPLVGTLWEQKSYHY